MGKKSVKDIVTIILVRISGNPPPANVDFTFTSLLGEDHFRIDTKKGEKFVLILVFKDASLRVSEMNDDEKPRTFILKDDEESCFYLSDVDGELIFLDKGQDSVLRNE
jgi:hypothetical protein